MNGGRVLARRFPTARTTAVGFVLVMQLLQVGFALAQTPDEACAADSLYLISPPPGSLDLKLETEGRVGLTISWPDLDLNEATCFSLKNTDDLDFEVGVTGGFGDRVDRVFNFRSENEGVIGAAQPSNIIVTWSNEGPETYGNIGGKLNLANNGGIWRYSEDGSGWTQHNSQLPMYWMQANTVALAAGSGGFMVAGFSRGVTAESDPVGLFTYDGADWTRIAAEWFDETKLITSIAVSPDPSDNNKVFAVGTARDGLFVTTDGGDTFEQWTVEFDPGYADMPTIFRVNVLEWSGNRVFAFVNTFGLFISEDKGASFARSDFLVPENLDVPGSDLILPVINALSFHPDHPDTVIAALQFHGAYESFNGGGDWHDLNGDLVVPGGPDNTGAWVNSGLDVLYDDVSPQTMLMGVMQKGLYRSSDGGATWVLVGDSIQPGNRGEILALTMIRLTGTPGTIFVLENKYSLLRSTDSGATWEHFASQPVINKGHFLLADATGSGDLTMGSWGGGMYIPDTPISLTETYSTITSAELRSLDLGLDITFSSGSFHAFDSFKLVCQTFQGWAVWRGLGEGKGVEEGEEELEEEEYSPRQVEMTLLGLYDRVNPEDCFEGYCGDVNIVVVPNCFAAKRAACFNLDDPGIVRFFDEEIYNGFTYNYSVTSFDYGNTALTTAENNTNDMIFSARYMGDQIEYGGISVFSVFQGEGNNSPIQINQPISVDEFGKDEEIYVFPNPLRMGAGFPEAEGGGVTFAKLEKGSMVLIFTTAGDRIIDIGP